MKLKPKIKGEPHVGQIKYEKQFLLFPLQLNDDRRWFEWVVIVSRYEEWFIVRADGGIQIHRGWKELEFQNVKT